MLESYVTPILMSYVNRYIKNLKPSDLQLSLWGGDVVLSKLELKLDVLEQELKLPFTFLSGHIHELRIHVPWTKLGSESVVITINTMECILKLKDGVQDDHESCGSSSTSRSNTESAKSPVKPRKIQQAAPSDPDLPPGYVQSLIRRVVNNVNIVVNNLILKYVEDDIVLSVNITCAECYTVDEFWDRAFMDISGTELVLRKVINFSDCTVCLDKRNASGKIEFYQDPLLYKCSFRTRLHFTYDSLNSKMPAVIKIHTMVDSLKLSLTDQQLPMFIRILQLGIALYYGEIGNSKEEIEDPPGHTKDTVIHMPGSEEELTGVQYPTQETYPMQDDDQQGWVSWAWSFVPAIVSYDNDIEGEDGYIGSEEGGVTQGHQSQQSKDPIISIGFYCTKATVTFKLTEMQAESSYYSPQKVKSREVIRWEQEGTTIEVLMKGEPFFDCQVGFVGSQAICLKGIMGIKDFEENTNRADSEACFFTCGESLSNKGNAYLTNSLFDYRSPENNGIRAEFILESCSHKETYTEIAGMQRFGALYMDYLYTMECTSGKGSINQQDFQATKPDENGSFQEMSIKRLVVGPIDLRFDSSSVHRIMKMVACSFDHEYEAYGSSHPVVQEECKTLPTPEEVASLEEYIPTRQTCVTLLKCTITITMAEFNLLGQLIPVILGQKHSSIPLNTSSFQSIRPLPAITILADKINIEHSEPMYAEQLVQTVSSLIQPSDNLLHHCYAHCYLKVFGFQAGLTFLDNKGTCYPPVPVIPAFSTALYGKLLRLPQYWTKRTHVPVDEYIFELPNLTIQATRAQTLLLQVICQSWSYGTNSSGPSGLSEALLTEVFSGVKSKNALPTLEGSIQNVELKFCSTSLVKCVSGTLGSIKICAKAPGDNGKEKLIPLVQGPSDTKELHRSKWLKESRKPESLLGPDLIAFTVQVPEQMDYCHSSGAVLLASVQGLALNVDPVLYTWLLYQPQRKGDRQPQQPLGSAPLAMPLSRKKEDEVSIGSTPLAKQASNQPSEYASSPVKTKTVTESRPLSVPAKMLQTSRDSSKTAEERMKEIIRLVWNAVKRLTLQVDIQTCCVFFPNDSLPSPSTIVSNDIPGTVRSWYHGQASMPGTLVFCLPNIKIMSASHKHIEPIQEIPFVVPRPIVEEGVAFPWTINLYNFSVYTLVEHQFILNLVEPMGCTSTLAVTSHALPSAGPEAGHSFVVCLHVDLEPLEIKCSNPQVTSNYDCLFGKDADRVPLSHREKIWRNIIKKINALGVEKRSTSQLKRKWYDCKRLVKAKLSKIHQHSKKTGGGPPTTSKLNDVEEMVADTLHREQIEGIGKYDLMAGLEDTSHGSKEAEDQQVHPSTTVQEEIRSASNPEVEQTNEDEEPIPRPNLVNYEMLPNLVQIYMTKNEENQKQYMENLSKVTNVVEQSSSQICQQVNTVTQAIVSLNATLSRIADHLIDKENPTHVSTSETSSTLNIACNDIVENMVANELLIPSSATYEISSSPHQQSPIVPEVFTPIKETDLMIIGNVIESPVLSLKKNKKKTENKKKTNTQAQFLLNIKKELGEDKENEVRDTNPKIYTKRQGTCPKGKNTNSVTAQTLKRKCKIKNVV